MIYLHSNMHGNLFVLKDAKADLFRTEQRTEVMASIRNIKDDGTPSAI